VRGSILNVGAWLIPARLGSGLPMVRVLSPSHPDVVLPLILARDFEKIEFDLVEGVGIPEFLDRKPLHRGAHHA